MSELAELLTADLHPVRVKLDRRAIDRMAVSFRKWQKRAGEEGPESGKLVESLAAFLQYRLEKERGAIEVLDAAYAEFNKKYADASTSVEKREHILWFAQKLGADKAGLKKDKKAFGRWFGPDTVAARYHKRLAARERGLAFCLDRFAAVSGILINAAGPDANYSRIWKSLKIDRIVEPLLEYDGDQRVRIESFKCLSKAIAAMPKSFQRAGIEENSFKRVFRAALDSKEDVWIQTEALALLESVSPDSSARVLKNRLPDPAGGDNIFVKAKCVELLVRNLSSSPELGSLVKTVLEDPSPFVRQKLAFHIGKAGKKFLKPCLSRLCLHDASPQVRAAAILNLSRLARSPELSGYPALLMKSVLAKEKDPFALRVALKTCADGAAGLVESGRAEDALKWFETLSPGVEALRETAENLSVRRWAAQYRERMFCETDPRAKELLKRLAPVVSRVRPGKSKRLPRGFLRGYEDAIVGRTLSVLARKDFGLGLERGLLGDRLYRDYRFGFRMWRFLFEFFHPSPEKRQAFDHTVGRECRGSIQAPSAILSELAATKTPGEPLFMATESGWRPYLPLVDQVVSALSVGPFSSKPTDIYTSEGVTRISPQRFFPFRWFARIVLAFRFGHYARLRNREEKSAQAPSAYIKGMRKLGVRITFSPYESADGKKLSDRSVERFFT